MARGRGTGSIREIGPNRHEVRFWEPQPDGSKKQRSKTVEGTNAAAERFLRKQLREIDTGDYVAPTQQTLAQHLDSWLDMVVRPHREYRTIQQYAGIVEGHIKPALGALPLQRLTTEKIQQFYNTKLELSNSRQVLIHVVLHQALDYAVKWGKIGHNPTTGANVAKRTKGRKGKALSAEQVCDLLQRFQRSMLYLPIYLAIHTGMRLGEILALKWENVNLDKGFLVVEETAYEKKDEKTGKPERAFKSPKSNESRVINLDPDVVSYLRHYRAEQGRVHGFVFAMPDGQCYKLKSVSSYFHKFIRRTELPVIRFHDLRHTHATLALDANVPLHVMKERLGHSSIGITGDMYAHRLEEADQKAASAVGNALRGVA